MGSTLQFRLPADDTHTLHISLYTWRAAPGKEAPKQDVVPSRVVPLMDEKGQFTNLDFTYHPQEAGYSRDADKIEAVIATWKDQGDELRRRAI
ncbi:MAG: hypothetical protein ACREOH_23295 [Candidatus Entotheonellia bacterium]